MRDTGWLDAPGFVSCRCSIRALLLRMCAVLLAQQSPQCSCHPSRLAVTWQTELPPRRRWAQAWWPQPPWSSLGSPWTNTRCSPASAPHRPAPLCLPACPAAGFLASASLAFFGASKNEERVSRPRSGWPHSCLPPAPARPVLLAAAAAAARLAGMRHPPPRVPPCIAEPLCVDAGRAGFPQVLAASPCHPAELCRPGPRGGLQPGA